ncbi:hypothetical protein MMC18_007476 [Xylographa bjoerkii]|nr:hypothetical protein [Xylographa bjoerkii]
MSSLSSLSSEDASNNQNDENSQMYKAAEAGDLERVKTQVQQVQTQCNSNELLEKSLKEALNTAISYRHSAVVSYLLDHGAKLDPSHIVPNVELVRWFLSHGADPNVRGRWNELPITVACCCSTPEVVDLLIAHGASLHHSDVLHLVAEDEECRPQAITMMSHLLDLGMDVNELSHIEYPEGRGRGYFTPLHAAVVFDFTEAVVLLIERGADPEIRNTLGETPLDNAIKYGNRDTIEALRKH